VDDWLVDAAFRTLGTNYLLPDVMDTLLEFDFNHSDLKFVERHAFNVSAISGTWSKVAAGLKLQVEQAEQSGSPHTAFALRQRLIHALIRSWSVHASAKSGIELWSRIDQEVDQAINYLKTTKNLEIERVSFRISAGECHGILRIPANADKEALNLLVVLPGMDMTKEYFPSLIGYHTDFRDFATISIDPPGHGSSFVKGVVLSDKNMEEFLSAILKWANDSKSHEFVVGKVGILGIGTSSTYAFRAGLQNESLSVVAGFEGGFLFDAPEILAKQSRMRISKLATMMNVSPEEVPNLVDQLGLSNRGKELKVPFLFSVGEHDDLFPKRQIQRFLDMAKSVHSLNFYEDEGHVLGKVINESLMTILDQIECCFRGELEGLKSLRVIGKRG